MNSLRHFKTLIIAIVGALLLSACTSTSSHTALLETTAYADGPFFEGPNSLMAEYSVSMDDLIASNDYQLNSIDKVTIQDIVVALVEEDETDMSNFSSVSLSIVSANEPLTGIATLNPIESTNNEVTLSSSEEVDLAPFFKEGAFTLVLDWEFKADDYGDQMSSKIKMNLNLELLSK